jgi:AcrR family transcriptional regulator
MTSVRNTPEVLPDPVLEAVRASVLAVGVRRTTLTDVAKRAGVSRMTLYRRAPDVTALILELLARDLGSVVAAEEQRAAHLPTGRERLVATAVGVVERLPREPLLRRVLEVDPELLLPYLVQRQGSTQRFAVAEVRRLLDSAVADGSVRPCDTSVVAACLVHVITPFVVGRAALPRGSVGAVRAELSRMLDGWLAP